MGHFLDLPRIAHPDFSVPGRKPVDFVLDTESPLFGRLKAVLVGGRYGFLDILGGRRFESVNGAKIERNGINTDATDSYIKNAGAGDVITYSAASDVTMLVVGKTLKKTGVNPGFWRASSTSQGNDFFIVQGSSSKVWARYSGSDVINPSSSPVIDLEKPLIIRVRSGKDASYFSNGVNKYTAAHSITGNAFSIYNIGYQATVAERVYGDYELIAFFGGDISNAECESLTKDPCQLFKPAIPLQLYVPSGAALNNTRISAMHFQRPWEPIAMGQ